MGTKILYLLCEGTRDEVLYERLAERVTGFTFARADHSYRVRRNANCNEVVAIAKRLIIMLQRMAANQELYLILSIDNDRSPGHPGDEPMERPRLPADAKKESRWKLMTALAEQARSGEASISTALAVTVEMVESWLLVLLNPTRPALPRFTEAAGGLAAAYYQGSKIPPQLKDLWQSEVLDRSTTEDDLILAAAEADLTPAVERSKSLALFVEQLAKWSPYTNGANRKE